MFTQLNDDCMHHIIRYLDIDDQLTLLRIDRRLGANVCNEWRHKKSYTLSRDLLDKFERCPQDLEDFLYNISPSVKELTLEYVKLKQLQLFQPYSFDNMRKLDYKMDHDENGEDATQLLLQLFPALTSLKMESYSSGNNFWKWTELQELDISNCWGLNPKHCERIFKTLKLKKLSFLLDGEDSYKQESLSITRCTILEELEIDDFYLTDVFLTHLLNLPKFRKLSVQVRGYPDTMIAGFVQLRALDVKKVIFNDAIWTCTVEILQQLIYMEQLTLYDDSIAAEDLNGIISSMPLLQQLDLIEMHIWKNASQLWKTVECCPSLKVLNLTGTQLSDNFFIFNELDMTQALKGRTTHLTIHCHNSIKERESIIRKCFNHSKLNISFEPLKVDYVKSGFIQIILKPLQP